MNYLFHSRNPNLSQWFGASHFGFPMVVQGSWMTDSASDLWRLFLARSCHAWLSKSRESSYDVVHIQFIFTYIYYLNVQPVRWLLSKLGQLRPKHIHRRPIAHPPRSDAGTSKQSVTIHINHTLAALAGCEAQFVMSFKMFLHVIMF